MQNEDTREQLRKKLFELSFQLKMTRDAEERKIIEKQRKETRSAFTQLEKRYVEMQRKGEIQNDQYKRR